jgi:hypothetical protein
MFNKKTIFNFYQRGVEMLRRTLLPLAAICLAFAVSCGSSLLRQVQVRSVTEAEYLQAEAAGSNIRGDEVAIADGFLAKAKANPKQAAEYADLAAAYYQIALSRSSLEASGRAVAEAEAALTASQEQVDKYQELLTRVNAKAGGE